MAAKQIRIPQPGDLDWVHREYFDGFERSYWTETCAACRQEATKSIVHTRAGTFDFPVKNGELCHEQRKLEWSLGAAYQFGYEAALGHIKRVLDGKSKPPPRIGEK